LISWRDAPEKERVAGAAEVRGQGSGIFGNDTMTIMDVSVGKNGWKKSWRDHFGDVTEMIETQQRKRFGKTETPAKKKRE
jgi:hypothetical protein